MPSSHLSTSHSLGSTGISLIATLETFSQNDVLDRAVAWQGLAQHGRDAKCLDKWLASCYSCRT